MVDTEFNDALDFLLDLAPQTIVNTNSESTIILNSLDESDVDWYYDK